ncbi:MAG: NADH:flavin oxidoreductase/NADH oxidase [Acidobacteriota bacterium]|jgi:2,4-dienoyl-CoA reductase-like NADH-dependent reductase (Old Yellow Enzyme family)
MSKLFEPLTLRELTFKNRIFVSPMCQYSAREGVPSPWHLVHLGSRAVGGAALVLTEATAVSPEGRISPGDTGLWNEEQVEAWKPVTRFIRDQGAVPGVQIGHAGRKASCSPPWEGGGAVPPQQGGWIPEAPSPVPFSEGSPVPRELSEEDLERLTGLFAEAAKRADRAGFDVVELHMAHGYLLHEFLSPLSNRRTDAWGGSLENRMRLPLRVAGAVREAWPAGKPLFVRISVTDWVEGGWDLEQSVIFSSRLRELGVDLMDCSSGALVSNAPIPAGPGYQTQFAQAIREQCGIAAGAVGMITEPVQAEHILSTGQADAVLLARELLRDPYWPLRAASDLGADVEWPAQYRRAKK